MDGFRVARPILFSLDPERAHALGLRLLRFAERSRARPLPVRTALGELASPVGLAAGYDKTGRYVSSLAGLGFGYLVVGTFTATAWAGNPRPRVARGPARGTLVNSLGFPNPGVEEFVSSLSRGRPAIPLVASISGRTAEDVLSCYSKVQERVEGVELNLSSPNTAKLKDLREPRAFADLAGAMAALKSRPTYLKLPPYMGEEQFGGAVQLARAWDSLGFEGVTASNTIPVSDERMAVGTGGLSGPPLLEHTKAAVKRIRALGTRLEVNACGGISGPADARALLELGATTVQLLTALVYQGPSVVSRIVEDGDFRRLVEQRRMGAGGSAGGAGA